MDESQVADHELRQLRSNFALLRFEAFDKQLRFRYRPTLLAGLLKHWGQKGPAEIPAKRSWTYRSCNWWAMQHGIPFRFPAAHPFNPLPYLRLAIAANNAAPLVRLIFQALWTTGADPAIVTTDEMKRVTSLPIGATRRID